MDSRTLLEQFGFSKTRNRINILDTLRDSRFPLSGKEICGHPAVNCDLSTVHRTLNTLFERKILQRVIVDHEVKYALRDGVNGKSRHKSDHIHFKCSVCNRLFCLTDIEVTDYNLPEGFVKEENQFLVIGKCKECN